MYSLIPLSSMPPSNSPLLLPLLLVLLLLPLLATAQRGGRAQWFLTGRESHPQQDRSFSLFRPQGDTRSTQGWTWADPDPDLEVDQDLGVDMEGNHSEMGLAFGGALWRLEARGQGEAGARLLGVRGRRFLATVLQLPEEEQEQEQEAEGPSGVGSVVSQVHSYGIFVTKDYEHPYGLEIGLMEEFSREFSQRKIHELRLGKELRIVVRMPATRDLPETEHHIVIAEDIRERLSLTQHTWHSVYPPPLSLPPSSTATPISHNPDYNVRLMTYNIWHNNPPTWVVSSSQRTAWYDERLALLTHYINQEDPDIITFQEVRLDSSFPHEFKPETSPAAAPGEKENGNEGIADRGPGSLPREALETIGSRPGSQMHHLLDALQQRIASYSEVDGDDGCNDVLCKYQLVYQPAMSMHDRNKPFERNEEGVAMLVRATSRQRNSSKLKKNENEFRLEVSRVQPLFLGRDMDNKMDDHHRVILHAEVRLVPVTSTPETATVFPVIDVMTTHLSLSSPARVQSMEAVWHFSAIATDKDNGEAFGTHVAPPPPKHSSLVEEVEVSVSGDTIVSDNEVATDTAPSIGFTRGNVQIVTGDFNAEPHEPAYRFITGQLPPVVDPVPEGVEGSMPSQCHPDFQDAWVVGGDEESESDGYTFPSCNPVKRIDFILVRNSSSTKCFKSTDNGDWKATIEHTRRVGLEPTTETADRVGAREGLGMLDHDSPIWASDHFALVTDLRLYHHD